MVEFKNGIYRQTKSQLRLQAQTSSHIAMGLGVAQRSNASPSTAASWTVEMLRTRSKPLDVAPAEVLSHLFL